MNVSEMGRLDVNLCFLVLKRANIPVSEFAMFLSLTKDVSSLKQRRERWNTLQKLKSDVGISGKTAQKTL